MARIPLESEAAFNTLLTSLTAAYLPRNTRPRVTSITVHTPGTVYQRPFPTGEPEIAGFDGDTPDRRASAQLQGAGVSGPNLGRRDYEKGLLTFMWRAEDENRDDLLYDLWDNQPVPHEPLLLLQAPV